MTSTTSRVLYISTSDIKGGAARGAYRLHRGFLKNGVESELLVKDKHSSDETVTSPQGTVERGLSFVRGRMSKSLLRLQRSPNSFPHSINLFPGGIASYINRSDADIVVLHWIGAEMLSIGEIGRIDKKIVWRLADQWAFSGAEHYVLPGQDMRYIEGYSRHNRPRDHKGLDLDRWTWRRKRKHYLNKPMTIVTGSRWLADCARRSYLFHNKRIEVIPSGLDTTIYKPIDRASAREVLNLPQAAKLVLFGSLSATSDTRKGYHLLLAALDSLARDTTVDIRAIVFGASRPAQAPDCGIPCHYLSTLSDDWSLALAYSAADVFVLPTMQDNLPYTVIEAMSCGTPCVSFEVGGLPEMIEHRVNGWLAKPYDCDELALGIRTIVEDEQLHERMSGKCRAKALQEYDVNVQVDRYLSLFRQL